MRILITGATGFIGGHLIRRLGGEHEVFALAKRPPTGRAAGRAVWIEQNLNDPLDYSRLPAAVDTVVHLAQSEFYKEFPGRAGDIFGVNVRGTFNLLEYARGVGARQFVFTSTGGVYGASYEKFVETDPVIPINFYLSSKYIAELLVGNYQQFFDTIVFRVFFAYGAGQKNAMLIPRLIRSVLSDTPITLQGSEGIHINPIHVSDAVAAIGRALELEGSHLINLAGPQVLSLREIGNVIGGRLGRAPRFTASDEPEPYHLVGDITKLKELLGGPLVEFSDGVAEVCSEAERGPAGPDRA
ncbi:MAG: NAD(P)-dependent oxidoreductase [Acidobacteriota bacterium]|nr:NAD(P)-dependent oxidoreductase [Acidobacteriota bacterium]